MAKYAIIEDGKVVNTVLAEPEYASEKGWIESSEEVGIGWSYVDGELVDLRPAPEPDPVPSSPTKEELLAQLQALQSQIASLGE